MSQHLLTRSVGQANRYHSWSPRHATPPLTYFEPCAGTPFRYSATLVLGLGTVHVCLGAVSAILAITALFVETGVNGYAAGLWTGILYIGCGITGILAYSR